MLERVEGWGYTSMIVTGGEEPESIAGAQVTPGLFDMLGVRPAIGRGFDVGEGLSGRDHVVILSDALWRRQFGGDPAALGRDIVLNDERYTVIGVMARGFRFPAEPQKLWLPVSADGSESPRRLEGLATLKAGLTQTLAQQRLNAIAVDLNKTQSTAAGWDVLLMPFRSARIDETTRRALQLVLGAVVLVLLIACANVANLFFAQAIGRQRELAIRGALGGQPLAPRARTACREPAPRMCRRKRGTTRRLAWRRCSGGARARDTDPLERLGDRHRQSRPPLHSDGDHGHRRAVRDSAGDPRLARPG